MSNKIENFKKVLEDVLKRKCPFRIKRAEGDSFEIIVINESVQTTAELIIINEDDFYKSSEKQYVDRSELQIPICPLSKAFRCFLIENLLELVKVIEKEQSISCRFKLNGFENLIFESNFLYQSYPIKLIHRNDIEFDHVTFKESDNNAIAFSIFDKKGKKIVEYEKFGDFKSISALIKRVDKEIDKYLVETRS